MMLPIDLEISDLPPPETVQGLWHKMPSARDATKRHAVPSICFSRRIFVPQGSMYVTFASRVSLWRAAGATPFDSSFPHTEFGVLRDVEDVRILAIDGVAFRLNLHAIAQPMHGFSERDFLSENGAPSVELRAQNISRKRDGTACMLFFAEAVEIGRIADLRLYFFFAIAVVIVGNHRNNDALLIAAGKFESIAAVVFFVFVAPAHAVFALPRGGLIEVRQAEIFLLQAGQCGARMTQPVWPVQCRPSSAESFSEDQDRLRCQKYFRRNRDY